MAIRDAIIAVDFDGTVVTHAYPHIGNDIGAVPVLRELIIRSHIRNRIRGVRLRSNR